MVSYIPVRPILKEAAMWIVVGMAGSPEIANDMLAVLEAEGLLVKVRELSGNKKHRKSTFEVLVLESELDSAQEILRENGF